MAALPDRLTETPSQTAGPFVHIGMTPGLLGFGVFSAELGAAPFPEAAEGERVTVTGRVLDGAGAPVTDAVIESWQADGAGRFGPGAQGFARRATDAETGEWRLETIRPGPVPWPGGGVQAPHIALRLVARGVNLGLQTRLYFGDAENSADPLLARLGPRAGTLIAPLDGPGAYRFDIRLQGTGETVFLDM